MMYWEKDYESMQWDEDKPDRNGKSENDKEEEEEDNERGDRKVTDDGFSPLKESDDEY